jgi:hypothetical protein
MKQTTIKLLSALTLGAALAYTPVASAAVIYQDNFNRTGDLNGSTPTITTGGNTWSSANWSTDGTSATLASGGWLGLLAFTPTVGSTYTLTATLNPTFSAAGNTTEWFVLGFTDRSATDSWFAGNTTASAGYRINGETFAFNGPATGGYLGSFGTYTAFSPQTITVVLDATDANSALWTTEVKVNGATMISPTALGFTPTINYVGIGSGGAGGLIDDFSLTVVAVPGLSPYARWADTNAGGQTADLDWDNDGVTNGVEFFMNAVPGFTANPGLVGNTVTWPNGGNIPSSGYSGYGTQFVVQTSNDLVNWYDVTEGDVDQNGTNTASSLSYTLDPANNPAKQFVRLKVTPN